MARWAGWPTYPGTTRVVLGCAARQGPGETYGQRIYRQRRLLVELVETIANQRSVGVDPERILVDVVRRAQYGMGQREEAEEWPI